MTDRGHHLALLATARDVAELGVGVARTGVGERDRPSTCWQPRFTWRLASLSFMVWVGQMVMPPTESTMLTNPPSPIST